MRPETPRTAGQLTSVPSPAQQGVVVPDFDDRLDGRHRREGRRCPASRGDADHPVPRPKESLAGRPVANPSSKAIPNAAPPPKATVSSSDRLPNTRWTLASVVAGKSMITP